MTVRVRASCRADLAGGTLDIWPIGLLHPGARTVNVALALSTRVTARRSPIGYRIVQGGGSWRAERPEDLLGDRQTALVGLVLQTLGAEPVELEIESDSPRGAGLGASSALTVALIRACDALAGRAERGPGATARLARDLEARLMGLPTGCQDHYPALLGGVLDLRYPPGEICAERIDVDLEKLSASLVLAYSGASHVSAENNWSVVRSRLDGDPRLIELFDSIATTASRVADALAAGDLEAVGRGLTMEWRARRQLSEVVSIPILESLLEGAIDAGAWGGKACGAGGGGCVALLAPPAKRSAVEARLEELGAVLLPGGCVERGLDLEALAAERV